MARILFGTAGWSYDDWRGRVYPNRASSRFDGLAYLARYLDLVEVNSGFYRLPRPGTVRSWLERTADRPGFLFLLKAPRDWTHARAQPEPGSVARFRELAEILAADGRLGALLLQFPWSFRNSDENRERIAGLVRELEGLPVSVEVRHGGFARPEWFEFLRSLGCLPVNIDQPLVGDSLPLSTETGGGSAYFRFHGRNATTWFDAEAGRDARYDYLYDERELEELAGRIDEAGRSAEIVFVITNNHFLGQAVANALQLKFRFLGEKLPHPPALLRVYPQLKKNALPLEEGQGELFS